MSVRSRHGQQQQPPSSQRPGFFTLAALVSAGLYARTLGPKQGAIFLKGGEGQHSPPDEKMSTDIANDSRNLKNALGAPYFNADDTHAEGQRRPSKREDYPVGCGVLADRVGLAIGVAVLFCVLYGAFSFLQWFHQTGLGANDFFVRYNSSAALGCPDAPFQTVYEIEPISVHSIPEDREVRFQIDRQSTLSGTIEITKSSDPAQWEFKLVARASTASGLDALLAKPPTSFRGQVTWDPPAAFTAPSDAECLRYDLTIGLPTNPAAKLVIDVLPVTHVRFGEPLSDPENTHALETLNITLHSFSGPWIAPPRLPRSTDPGVEVASVQRGMSTLMLSPGIAAMRAAYKVHGRGFVWSTANVLETLEIDTTDDVLADAILRTYPYHVSDSNGSTTHNIVTRSGGGYATRYRIDQHLSYSTSLRPSPLNASHTAAEDLYVDCIAPKYSGSIHLADGGTGHKLSNVKALRGRSIQDKYYVGDVKGPDSISIKADKRLFLRFW